jgi:hypothetical protein
MTLTMNRVRYALMAMFLVGLIVQLAALIHVRNAMFPEEFQSVLMRLLSIYSAQLGVVVGGIFAEPKGPSENPPSGLAATALASALLWNLLLAWRTVAFSVDEQDSPSDLMKYLDSIAASSSFLIAGALAFFFGKSKKPSGHTNLG